MTVEVQANPGAAGPSAGMTFEQMVEKAAVPAAEKAVGNMVSLQSADLEKRLVLIENALQAGAITAGQSVEARISTDKVLDRWMEIVGTVVVGLAGLIVLVFYLNGNKQAADIKDVAFLVLVPIVKQVVQKYLQPTAQVPVSAIHPVPAAPATATATATTA